MELTGKYSVKVHQRQSQLRGSLTKSSEHLPTVDLSKDDASYPLTTNENTSMQKSNAEVERLRNYHLQFMQDDNVCALMKELLSEQLLAALQLFWMIQSLPSKS